MSSKQHVERFAHLLTSTGVFEVTQTNFGTDWVAVLARLHAPDKEFVAVARAIKVAEKSAKNTAGSFVSHLCKDFFGVDEEGKLRFRWHLRIQASSMSEALDAIARSMKGQKPASNEPQVSLPGSTAKVLPGQVEEVYLPGMEGRKDRNVPDPKKRKGATTIG